MEGRELARMVIGRRMADKARAPHATAAKNALNAAQRKLRKLHGDVNIDDGSPRDGAWAALQRGETVTLTAWKLVSQGDGSFFDPDKYEAVGTLAVSIDIR